MGTNCSVSPKTINCLYDIASDAGLVPDASLDASLATMLSLNSSRALEQQYSDLQSGMTQQQRFAFNGDLSTLFGGNMTVTYGGVGVVALALSILFEMLAHHQTTGLGLRRPEANSQPPDPIRRMFGADPGSDISSIASEFLKQVKQWMNGAALHIHTFLHWNRLTNPSAGEHLSLDYLHQVDPLLKAYKEYLLKTVKVLPALSPGPSGSLIVEPLRNVSHEVHLKVCERKLIQRALAERFLSAQNLQRGKEFFQSSHKHHEALMAQQEHFVLSMV
ncbi:uncharacterized protein LOC128378966 isoform X2 [Scomber scombrus]|uniref:Uncharacterized protein LOC128378966 isoform X2 n=1 Tax=Scomber scombrus TaxID=13677 RepID=A0AAV1NLU0_SCOSC